MCRLFGYVAPAPTTVERLLGSAGLREFGAMSRLHGDGWGTTWVSPDGSEHRQWRSTEAADRDLSFTTQTRQVPSTARILHLRWATLGLPIQVTNTHPFTANGIGFAHNGALTPVRRIEDQLNPLVRASLAGTTDSERYFALIRQELLTTPGDVPSAVARAVSTLRALFPISSLNALLLTEEQLVVVHANSEETAPRTDEMTVLSPDLLRDHLNAYYLMRWRRGPDGAIAFTSSGLGSQGWIPLPEHSITTVRLATLEMNTVAVEDACLPSQSRPALA